MKIKVRLIEKTTYSDTLDVTDQEFAEMQKGTGDTLEWLWDQVATGKCADIEQDFYVYDAETGKQLI